MQYDTTFRNAKQTMMPASKHGDPQLGVDIHLYAVPTPPSPIPLPTLHISVVFDPFDLIPVIGATVRVKEIGGSEVTPISWTRLQLLGESDDEV